MKIINKEEEREFDDPDRDDYMVGAYLMMKVPNEDDPDGELDVYTDFMNLPAFTRLDLLTDWLAQMQLLYAAAEKEFNAEMKKDRTDNKTGLTLVP